jgi:hypothetical protein
MKKLIMALICGLVLSPVFAWGQKWIEPYTDKDGKQVEGHWQTPEDVRQDQYSTPGRVNPYTGLFNPYTGSGTGTPGVTPTPQNPAYSPPSYRFPGESATPPPPPTSATPNPYYPQQDYRYRGK